jgi:hypothetical protein
LENGKESPKKRPRKRKFCQPRLPVIKNRIIFSTTVITALIPRLISICLSIMSIILIIPAFYKRGFYSEKL